MKAQRPRTGTSGAEQEGGVERGEQQRTQYPDLEKWKIIRGEPASTRSSWTNGDTIKDRATPSVTGGMKAKTREDRGDKRAVQTASARQSRKEKAQRTKDQLEERAKTPAPDWSTQGGAAHKPGQDHLGEWAQCPGLKHPGRGQKTRRRPPRLEDPECPGAKKSHKTGLDHPGKTKKASRRAPWI